MTEARAISIGALLLGATVVSFLFRTKDEEEELLERCHAEDE